MTAAAHPIERICRLGYSDPEAQFLYLVATHASYFTRGQFLRFSQSSDGRLADRFTTKTLQKQHARAFEYGPNTYIFNLFSSRIYGAIDKQNARVRHQLSSGFIHIRLLILDFVLAHLNCEYLETETQKVAHFHQGLGIPLPVLPGRFYKGLKAIAGTRQYFVDHFPIFLTPQAGASPRSPVPTFVYCDAAEETLMAFANHLRNYENLLRRLPAFHFIYAAATAEKFPRAAKSFDSVFGRPESSYLGDIVRYFQIRQLWESHRTSGLTRADRDLLRAGDHRYQGEPFESSYSLWTAGTLPDSELVARLTAQSQAQACSFASWTLPESYPIFNHRSCSPLRPSRGTEWSD